MISLFTRPQRAEFATIDDDQLELLNVRLSVSKVSVLTREQMESLKHCGAGVRQWWLRHHRHGFAAVDLPRGDKPFTRKLLLPAGRYTLGVGRGTAERRFGFEVDPAGPLTFQF